MRKATWAEQHYPDPGSLGASNSYVFVLRPADPLGARENVYLDSDSLYAAMSQLQGSKRIEIDGSFAPVTWTANGLQDLSGVEFFSSQGDLQGFTLNVDDGVSWTFDALYINGASIQSNSNSPVSLINNSNPNATAFLFIYLQGFIGSTTSAPFFDVMQGFFDAELSDASSIGDGTNPAVKVEAAGNFNCYFFDHSQLSDAALDTTSVGPIFIFYDSSSAPGNQGAATFTATLFDQAVNVQYTPESPTNWQSPPPTETAAALDRLAAWIQAHGGGPLP